MQAQCLELVRTCTFEPAGLRLKYTCLKHTTSAQLGALTRGIGVRCSQVEVLSKA